MTKRSTIQKLVRLSLEGVETREPVSRGRWVSYALIAFGAATCTGAAFLGDLGEIGWKVAYLAGWLTAVVGVAVFGVDFFKRLRKWLDEM